MPVLIDCNFVVDSTQPNGISSLKGAYVKNVFMQTSATKAAGSPGGTTGPAAGTIVVQLDDNYARFLTSFSSIQSPAGTPVKTDNSELTAGVAYTISTLGNASVARWHTLGVPAGITPAVGVSFIAASVGAGANSSTSRVAPSAAAGSGIFSIELVRPQGDLAPALSASQGFGAQLIFQCRNDSSSDAPALAAPADGSIISLAMLMSNSSILIAGE